MKKIIVNKVEQKGVTFYSMIADPRMVAKIRRKYIAGEKQDVQRPWNERKVRDISAYVVGKTNIEGKKTIGLIPNTPILWIKGGLSVQKEKIEVIENGETKTIDQYYIMWPETEAEIAQHENEMEIIDGQHRIIAFDEDYIDPNFDRRTKYEMTFNVYCDLSDNQRKELFMVTNEKQDKVETNLLRYIKKSLGFMLEEDEVIYDILDAINKESSSPLHNRIVFGADKIKKGYKETQLSKIFKLYGAKKFYDNKVIPSYSDEREARDSFIKIINNYLSAWEELSNVSFQQPGSDTITKISGIRYLMYVFPEICERLINDKERLTKENFIGIISKYDEALGLENIKCVFCDDKGLDNEEMVERGLAFRGEGATIALAKSDIQKVLASINNEEMGGLI